MKYLVAKEIGEECGLEQPAEFVNNIILHSMHFFVYTEIAAEQKELIEDSVSNGVRFSEVCGDAVIDNDPVDERCYMCRAIAAAGASA